VNIFSLEGKTILFTGGTGYLGQYISKALVEAGARLICTARSQESLAALNEFTQEKVDGIVADLSDGLFATRVTSHLATLDVSCIDCLINGAYSGIVGDLDRIQGADFHDAIEKNTIQPFLLMRTLLPMMKRSKSKNTCIINVASMYGKISPNFDNYGVPEDFNPIHYGATKAAMIQMTRYLACRLAKDGINVNSVSPGAFPNPGKNTTEFIEKLSERIPLGRVGHPEELTGAVVFLASDGASYVTGTDLAVDGGWTAW